MTLAAAIVILGIVLVINWVRDDDEVFVDILGIPTGPAPAIGQVPQDFEIPLVANPSVGDVRTTFRLSQHKGEVVWLNIWASWCAPCRAEMPDINKLWEEFKGQGVMLVGVAFSEPYEDSISYMAKNKFTVPVGLDPGGKMATDYRLSGLPTHFFIDKDGVLRRINQGPMSEEAMRAELQKLLGLTQLQAGELP